MYLKSVINSRIRQENQVARIFFTRMIGFMLLAALIFTISACGSPQATETAKAGSASPKSPATQTSQSSQAGQDNKTGPAAVVKVSADEALKILNDNATAVLLDVRTTAEYDEGHIEGSQLLPVEELAGRISELPQDKSTPIVVYCRSGRRSALAAAQLTESGYTQVFDLGGIQSWPYDIVK